LAIIRLLIVYRLETSADVRRNVWFPPEAVENLQRFRADHPSAKRPLNGQAWNVRKPWTSDGNPDCVVGGRENGQNAVANVGYARVSTIEQSPALRCDALAAAGCVKVFEDRASGARADRAGLLSALDYVRDGDVLIVWKLDRLGRSLPHLIGTVTSLAIRGVGFRSITEAIDTTTPGGRLVFHLFGALGQFERDLISGTHPRRACRGCITWPERWAHGRRPACRRAVDRSAAPLRAMRDARARHPGQLHRPGGDHPRSMRPPPDQP
jgi:hypothetical protein